MGNVGNKSIDISVERGSPSIYRLFMGISEPIMVSRYLSRWSVQQANTKGPERSVIPRVCRPERPATVKVSYLSPLMTWFDVSPFISEHASHPCAWRARRGLSPVPWTSPFVVNRPKSSLRHKSALPVVRLHIIAQLSVFYTKKKKKGKTHACMSGTWRLHTGVNSDCEYGWEF